MKRWTLALVISLGAVLAPVPAHAADVITQFGTALADYGTAVAADASGTYVVGQTKGAMPGDTSEGRSDAYVAHLDPAGSLVWIRQFGGPGDDFASDVAVHGSAVFVVGGTAVGDDRQAFVRSYDADGTFGWSRTFGTSRSDRSRSVVTDGGRVYVFGETSGTLGRRNLGGDDLFLRAYDAGGQVEWTRQFGTDKDDQSTWGLGASGRALYATGQGPVVDPRVHRFTIDGTHRWATRLNAYYIWAGAAADTGMVVAGVVYGLGLNPDAVVLSVRPGGGVRWRTAFGEKGDEWDAAGEVAIVGDRVFVAGDTSGDLTEPGAQHHSIDLFVRLLDGTTGHARRTWQMGSSGTEFSSAADWYDGRLWVAGSTNSRLPGQEHVGGYDVFVWGTSP